MITAEQSFEWIKGNKKLIDERLNALNLFTNDLKNTPLKWGKFDCVHMVAEYSRLIGTGNPLEGIKDYKTRAQAVKVIEGLGFNHLREAVDSKAERLESLGLLAPGDIVELVSGVKQMDALFIFGSPDVIWGFGNETPDKRSPVIFRRLNMNPDYLTGNAWRLI